MTHCFFHLFIFAYCFCFCLVDMRKIAIIGGGYAGLGSAYQFAKSAATSIIHIYDRLPAGSAEASSVSAGIMHPMATRGKLIWNGLKGMDQTISVMNNIQQVYNQKTIFNAKVQLNRLLFNDGEVSQWTAAATENPELLDIVSTMNQESGACGAVVIKRAALVNSAAYLKALWEYTKQSCIEAEWKTERVGDIAQLAGEYDVVILACGGGIKELCESLPLPAKNRLSSLRLVRGQNLVFRNPTQSNVDKGDNLQAYLCGEYVLPYTPDQKTTISENTASIEDAESGGYSHRLCGPTHEHITTQQYESALATPELRINKNVAEEQLRARITRIYPALALEPILGITGGTRVVTQRSELGRLPVVGKLPGFANVWVHTGFGSRGLILHTLTSKYLCHAIESGDESCIPQGLGVLA